MKVLVSANIRWVLWHYRQKLIRALQQAGYDTVLAAGADDFGAPCSFPLGVDYLPLRRMRRGSRALWRGAMLWSEYLAMLSQVKPDFCLFFTPQANIFGGLAARWRGCSYAGVIEGWGYMGGNAWRRRVMIGLYRIALGRADRVFFVNTSDLEAFVQAGICRQEQALLTQGAGVDLDRFALRPIVREGPCVFLFAARLLRSKGVCEFAEAARLLGREAECLIVGPLDPEHPEAITQEEMAAWEATGCLRYAGFHPDIRPYLHRAHAVVLPTYYAEGRPQILLEALAVGRAMLTVRAPGCQEMVDEGQNGLFVPARDPIALVAAMRRFIALGPEGWSEWGMHSRTLASRYADSAVNDAFLRLLREHAHRDASVQVND